MGSSTKKKNEKRKDFKKPKLKVGKSRPKPDNFTDTSFKAKGQCTLKTQVMTQIPDSDRSHRPCPPIPHHQCPHSIYAILPPPIPSLLPLIISTTRLPCLPHHSCYLLARRYTPPTACQRPPTESQPSNTGRQQQRSLTINKISWYPSISRDRSPHWTHSALHPRRPHPSCRRYPFLGHRFATLGHRNLSQRACLLHWWLGKDVEMPADCTALVRCFPHNWQRGRRRGQRMVIITGSYSRERGVRGQTTGQNIERTGRISTRWA